MNHPVSDPRVSMLTRFPAVDGAAARDLENELRRMAQLVTGEPGHLAYDVYAAESAATRYVLETWGAPEDARRHRELVESSGAVERIGPLLGEQLRTRTLRPVVLGAAVARAEVEMRTNYLSAVRLIDGVVPALRRTDSALIVTTSGVAFAPDITNPTYSATKAALHSLVQSVRLQLERDGSPLEVFEFMAPLVDSPFSAGVVSDEKMSAADAVAELFEGLDRHELEMHVGITSDIYEALRTSPDAAVRAVNVATGG